MVQGVVLWSDAGGTLVHDAGRGRDILENAVKRDDLSNDTLYFKFHVDPLSDSTTEEYFAAFALFDGDAERVGIGNALKAWAYSAYLNEGEAGPGSVGGYIDLHSARAEPAPGGVPSRYELPRRGSQKTIVFKVQFVAGGDDLITVWLDPDLGPGANEIYQQEALITRFSGNAAFDEIRLRHGGGGTGWRFSEMAIATKFSDFVDASSAKPDGGNGTGLDATPVHFRSWQREHGIPHGSIRALAQTRDGYIWIGSDEGLVRFDGVRFSPVHPRDSGSAIAVAALFGDSKGALWVGSSVAGAMRFEQGQWITLSAREGLPSDSITSFVESNDSIVIGTETGLAVWDGERVAIPAEFNRFKGSHVTALFKDRSGTLWVGIRGTGVFKVFESRVDQVAGDSVAPLLRQPNCLLHDQSGRLWVGAGEDSVLCLESGQWRRYRIPRHSANTSVMSLAEQPDGTIWAGSVTEGLFQFKGGKLTSIGARGGLSDNLVGALLVDREGKLWVGTDAALNRIHHKNIKVYSQDEGLGLGAVQGLAEVSPGVIWAVRESDGLYRWEGGTFNRLKVAGLPARDFHLGPLLAARNGVCWLACREGLLQVKDPQAVADETRLWKTPRLEITALAEDHEGNIWAGMREGTVWRLSAGKWGELVELSQASPITSIVVQTNGETWIGTDGAGLVKVRSGIKTHYGRRNGLGSDSIRVLLAANGAVWIGTTGGGLSCWRDGKIFTVTAAQGLPDNTIVQIVDDAFGRVWIGSMHGIACMTKEDVEQAAAAPNARIYPHVFGRSAGLISEECTTGFSPAGLKTRSGSLWFATTRGVVAIDARHPPIELPMPQAVLEEVLVDGVPVRDLLPPKRAGGGTNDSQNASIRIDPGRHRLEGSIHGIKLRPGGPIAL
ncbi:MAG TPA: two-component regulator propeller domain-containing protein [Verrucomicrobiae bacterium]|nr:two-component regulator propeller domain-containing protein [Verrucomicrobiae bacterium]